jgi:benzodiazapine receptor
MAPIWIFTPRLRQAMTRPTIECGSQEQCRVNEIASKGQLRMSFLRWGLVAVPALVLLGFLSGRSVPVGPDSPWYLVLTKPALTPPPLAFPIVWGALYVLMGLAVAIVLNARGAQGRGAALALFAVQFVLNLAWTPVFFGLHKVGLATGIIAAMLAFAIAATVAFARVRAIAAWLMVPYLVWISFAGVLTWRIGQLNPQAETLVPRASTSQVIG